MADERALLSVGLDVGTTTTQIVFSRIHLKNVAPSSQVPRIGIGDRDILYQSEIYFTPLATRDRVDVRALEEIVHREYHRGGFSPEQVETGAVIVTGEIAKKENAAEILQALGHYAGEFVVTVAGPRLEAQMAGRGSGAAAWSREHYVRVTNVDIGGGTANSAVFELGNTIAAAAMNVGGRIIEIDRHKETIRYIAEPARKIIQYHNLPIAVGGNAELGPLREFCNILAQLTAELIEGRESELAHQVMLTPPMSVSGRGTKLFISGGVGYYFYRPLQNVTLESVTVHDDIGPLFGLALRENETLRAMEAVEPPETIRATVIGASSQTVTLSGSTIWAEKQILPIKNVPVVRPYLGSTATIPDAVREAMTRMEIDPRAENAAIAVDIRGTLDFTQLQNLAQGLAAYATRDLSPDRPLILILGRDYAQSLGQTIKALIPQRALLAIDQVGLDEGDYIDIGMPMMDGRVVPLSVKTLVFYR
ncbi:MAG TPA: ethanolamine ammonia-lyase reactivating factor EutA [Anaerolineae bacterium]|nr:ethanolamine ammonia-lyase reactivating factor EutA [Anaerolineae bacterium]